MVFHSFWLMKDINHRYLETAVWGAVLDSLSLDLFPASVVLVFQEVVDVVLHGFQILLLLYIDRLV